MAGGKQKVRNEIENVCIKIGIVPIFVALSLFLYNQSEGMWSEKVCCRKNPPGFGLRQPNQGESACVVILSYRSGWSRAGERSALG